MFKGQINDTYASRILYFNILNIRNLNEGM
jgi:hypothetical protein